MPVEPGPDRLAELATLSAAEPEPVVMLNPNRYRERARYGEEPAGASGDVSGREAYERYAAVAARVLERIGARVLWRATLISCAPE